MLGGIGESAQIRLQQSPYFALRSVCCAFQEGVLILQGCLPSYYLKQLAQTVVGELEGVTAIVNQIEVITPLQRESLGQSDGRTAGAASSRHVRIENALGLHLRAADKFVRLAKRFQANVRVTCGDQLVNGKSILDLTTLAAAPGTLLILEADGPDAEQSLEALCTLIQARFDEPEPSVPA